ncbi:hypothetical protein C0991_003667 [Blastosporella zonata]|nr:hypothetical protein C0991_003667 [Blastosporella zonata]
MNSLPGRGILQLPPIDEPAPGKSFDIRKYTMAATTIMKSGRVNEHRKFNTMRLVCNLPFEVLQRIFIACAQTSFQTPRWSWVDLTFVCSTWRQAALDCHELWSYIDFSHFRSTSLSLYRSTAQPISLRARVDSNNQQSIYRTLHNAPIIRDVHLISSIYDIGPLMGALKNPNGALESLIINVLRPDNADNRDIRYSKRSGPLPGPRLPSMLYLELHRTPINLVSPRFTNLRHLSLHHLPFSERPSRNDFLTLLERFVMLEHLTLVHAFPKNVAAGSCNTGSVINLPNLLTISLTGSILELTNVLEFVAIPPTARVQCYVDKTDDFKTNFWRLTKVIGTHFHATTLEMPLDTLTIEVRQDSNRFTNGGYIINPAFRQSLRVRAFGAEPLLDLVIGPDANTVHDELIISALTSVWDALPLMNVCNMVLQNLDIVTQKSWPRLLYSLPKLRVIEMIGHCPSGLLWALLLNARSHSHLEHEDMSTLLLPTLEDIYLHNIDCFAGGMMTSPWGPVNSHHDLDDSRFLEVVFAYLEDRQRCSLPLRSLSISHCVNVSKTVLNDMRACVSHLLWDHRGLYKEGSLQLETERSAVYRNHWPLQPPPQRHYFRLQTLMELD